VYRERKEKGENIMAQKAGQDRDIVLDLAKYSDQRVKVTFQVFYLIIIECLFCHL
jgi:hypothetical protein